MGLTWPDDMRHNLKTHFRTNSRRRVNPCFPADAGEHRKQTLAAEVEGRHFCATVTIEHPYMRQTRARPCCRLVMQFCIKVESGFHLVIRDHSGRFVALVHFHAMRIEFIFLEGDGVADRGTLLFAISPGIGAGIHAGLDFLDILAAGHAERLKDRAEFTDGLVGAGHDLLGDRRAFYRIAVEKRVSGLALQHCCQLP